MRTHGDVFRVPLISEVEDDEGGNSRLQNTSVFDRMFDLPALSSFNPGPAALGAVGGPMDGGDPPGSDTSQNNPRIKAGYTFLGQFIDHDLTLDIAPLGQQTNEPVRNFRSPTLELDSVYGLGPALQPFLYDRDRPGRFLLGGAGGTDLPRNSQGSAIIGDPRNDENLIVSQLHNLMLRFHNVVFDQHATGSDRTDERFLDARRLVRWHYQWIVIHEFLVRTIGQQVVDDIVLASQPSGSKAAIPVEFSVAAYRFGHSQVRGGYRMNTTGGAGSLFPPGVPDLRGFRPVPANLFIDWGLFFGPTAQASKLIDPKISTDLLQLPDGVVPTGTPPAERSLAVRNLQRGIDRGLPSGQDAAQTLGVTLLTEDEIWANVPSGSGPAPLWYYVLREAEVRTAGRRLDGVGAEIVARVFRDILLADPESYLASDPAWTPTLPRAKPVTFTMTDLVNLTLSSGLAAEPGA
jgi:hypothetical protein